MKPLTGSVVVVGSTMTDMITYCDRFPEDGETLPGRAFETGFGGKGANQAVMAARMGCDVSFVGRVGDDATGAETIENLREQGIDTTWLQETPGYSSGMAPIWVDKDGTNRIIVVPGANSALTPDDIERALDDTGTADVVMAQNETPIATTKAAFEIAKGSGATTVLNPAPPGDPDDGVLLLTDWLIPNETEFAHIWGEAATPDAIEKASERWDCGVIVTLGENGAILATSGQTQTVPALSVDAVDTTGAGDAFVGTFGAALAAGQVPVAATQLACVTGSLSVTRKGTQTSFPTPDEVFTATEENRERSAL